MDERATVERLMQELAALHDPRDPRPFTFACEAFDAYTLVAVLQFATRNPRLSDVQRDAVLAIAHGVAGALTEAARGRFGPESAIETTLGRGFDPAHDVPAVDADPADDDDELISVDDLEPMSIDGVADLRSRYVVPTWIHLPGEEDAELSKCAACGRFFVSAVPLRAFTTGPEPVLGYEICDACAPALFGVRRTEGG